ncbi:MAG TPA: ComF family protein [Bacteroidia bacterium]|nr:ComF family protein [Bacteroidia bacterium]
MLITYLRDFFNLFYPHLCPACGRALSSGEQHMCSVCLWRLPKTNFHLQEDNPVQRRFWGKTNVASAASFVFFDKGEKVQRMLHSLKYQNNTELGIFLGELYGKELKASPLFSSCDGIVPVPLHLKKIRTRGYNQSDFIAEGLSKAMGIPVYKKFLMRTVATSTQTRKSRYARFENVENVFRLNVRQRTDSPGRGEKAVAKHFLLVDDIITTGSTLEACASCLNQIEGVKVSIATIACTF